MAIISINHKLGSSYLLFYTCMKNLEGYANLNFELDSWEVALKWFFLNKFVTITISRILTQTIKPVTKYFVGNIIMMECFTSHYVIIPIGYSIFFMY